MEAEAQQKRAKQDREILEKTGGDELKVLMFYANPPAVSRGERGLLCYGVSNASEVKIEPPVDGVSPSLSRCVEVRPTKNTDFTLKARDGKGREVAQTVTVQVR